MAGEHIVAVVGSGRCGTSLLMQILTACGLEGASPAPANIISNPAGGFEDPQIVAAHNAILGELKNPRLLPRSLTRIDQFELAPHKSVLAEIVQRRVKEGSIWGFKDPRTSNLTPLWNQVLQEMGISPRYVLCVRHPAAVAASMKRHFSWGTEVAEYLWLMRTIDPLITNPDRIFIVHYEDWFSSAAKRTRLAVNLLNFVGLPSDGVEATLASVIKPTLNRSAETGAIANPQLRKFYAALRKSKPLGHPAASAVRQGMKIMPIVERYMAAAREVYEGQVAARVKTVAQQAESRSSRQLAALREEHAREVARLGEELAQQKEIAKTPSDPHPAGQAGQLAQLATRIARQRTRSAKEIGLLRQDLQHLAEQHRRQIGEVRRAVEALGRANEAERALALPKPAAEPAGEAADAAIARRAALGSVPAILAREKMATAQRELRRLLRVPGLYLARLTPIKRIWSPR